MRFSIQWLQKFIDLKLEPQKLAQQLTDIGLEVEDLDGDIIEIAVPPNRADCLGIIGIAREVAAINNVQFIPPKVAAVPASINDKFKLEIKNSQACIKYLGRIVRGINNSGQSPQWMQDCLITAGMKVISPVVDITNYVQLEYGQPLHAFNLDAVQDQTVIVRNSKVGETLVLLDDSTVELGDDALLIADASKPMALAGIKGGKDSGVYADTKDILLECAYFDQVNIRLTSRKYKIQTDGSYRHERGIDPQMQEQVMQRITQLILETVGGKAGEIVSVVAEKNVPKTVSISLNLARINKFLGISVPAATVKKILQNLGMQIIAEQENGLDIQVPSFRTDISREIDLIEEITRIYGYNNIPAKLPNGMLGFNRKDEAKLTEQQIINCMINRGYNEAITYSFIDSNLAQKFGLSVQQELLLANPISSEMNLMRPSLLPGLIQALAYNQNRQQPRVRLFEIGLRFSGLKPDQQFKTIAAVATGNCLAENWTTPKRLADFYDLKGDVAALFTQANNLQNLNFKPGKHPSMHPAQCMELIFNGKSIGFLGTLHPRLQESLDLSMPVVMFELDYQAVATKQVPSFKEFSKYPAVRRDLALLVDTKVTYATLHDSITATVKDTLSSVVIFDVYQGKGIPEGKKSIAVGITLQSVDRTLTDIEVDDTFKKVINVLQGIGATLR